MPSQQHPIPSGFGAQASAHEVIGDLRLDDKLAIVTGGYSGIGVETTRVLVAAGAHVIVPARDFAKAESAVGALANVTIEPMDLSNPSTIAAFAARHVDTPLHLLVNNAASNRSSRRTMSVTSISSVSCSRPSAAPRAPA